jgi:hypothetical protein
MIAARLRTIFTPSRGFRSIREKRSGWKKPNIRQAVFATAVADLLPPSRRGSSPKN